MLDMVPIKLSEADIQQGLTLEDTVVRNRLAESSKNMLLKQKPSPITSKKSLELIAIGNFDDDLDKLAEVDWIIEVVTERLDIKKEVLANIDQYRRDGIIVSSNTSGISIEEMISGRSDDFKKHFLGTHFFNPPRYLKLLEIVPTKFTKPEVLSFMKSYGEDILGKGVVVAKDTPNFIANRIGTYGLLITVREMLKGKYSVGEVDSVTGPLIGRPKSATFRTLDVVGLDTFLHVAKNVYDHVDGEEKDVFNVPDFMKKMNERAWLGSKSGQGFYLKKGSTIYELNPETLEYEDRKTLKTAATEMAKQGKGSSHKMKALINAKGDRAGDLVWSIIKPVLAYSAELLGHIADDIPSIDNAMKWGFGWEAGPFEIWDAIGVRKTVARMQAEGTTVPKWVLNYLEDGHESFYRRESGSILYYDNGEMKKQAFNKKEINLQRLKEDNPVIKQNNGASLIDLGDGVALLEFHSKSNAIGLDIIQMINYSIDEVGKNL